MQELVLTTIPLEALTSAISYTVKTEFEKFISTLPPQKEQVEPLTRKQAAQFLGVSLVTLSKWTKEGKIKSYRISSRIRYKRSELENSLSQVITSKTRR